MQNFVFCNPTKIVFGRRTENETGAEAARYSKRVLLHFGGGSVRASGLLDRVKASLAAAGVEWIEFGGVKPNPSSTSFTRACACARSKPELVLAVGGGSVMDSAKAIAMGAVIDHDVWDFFVGHGAPTATLPVGTVLTLPAAGSETSVSSVITREEGALKRFFKLGTDLSCVLDPEPRAVLQPAAFPARLRRDGHHVPPDGALLRQRDAVGFTDRLSRRR